MKINELFLEKIKWSFHTCMDLEIAFQLMIMGRQYASPIDDSENSLNNISKAIDSESDIDIAFFYNKESSVKQGNVSIGKGKFLPVQNAEKYRHGLTCKNEKGQKQTFHAKVSLFCYEKEDKSEYYKIGVYSKNLTYSNSCLDIGEVYDVRFCQDCENNNSAQFASFINKIYHSASDKGQSWLSKHKLKATDAQEYIFGSNFKLIDKNGKEVSLYFGGCGCETHLYERIGLMNKDLERDKSIVLTPPYFVKKTRNNVTIEKVDPRSNMEKFLLDKDNGSILYHLEEKQTGRYSTSHAKAYLIKKNGEYSYFQGSANCTPRGIGVKISYPKERNDFVVKNGFESVECLVKYILNEQEFEQMYNSICSNGFKVCKSVEKSKPPIKENAFAKWLTGMGEVTKVQYFDEFGNTLTDQIMTRTKISKIEYTIRVDKESAPKMDENGEILRWFPLEYSDGVWVMFNNPIDNEVNLIYQKENGEDFYIRPSQQTLVIDGYAMHISSELIVNIPKPDGADDSALDIYMTRLLFDCKDSTEMRARLEKFINRVNKTNDKRKDDVCEDLEALRKILGGDVYNG